MLLFLILTIPGMALATESAAPPGVASSTYVQAILGLSLIVALLFATAWLARKVSGGKGFGQGGMKVIGGVALGPRERLVLVEIGDSWLVIGIVPGQIRTLHRLPKGDLAGNSAGDVASSPFANILGNLTAHKKND